MKIDKKKIIDLKQKLIEIQKIRPEHAEAIIHALIDIEKSITKIYTASLSKIFENGLSTDEFQELIWDLKEDFRHIDYHIHDADLTNL